MQLYQPRRGSTGREGSGNCPNPHPERSVPVSPLVPRNGADTGKKGNGGGVAPIRDKLKLKSLQDVQPKSFLYKRPELVSINMRGCIDLIACNQGLKEGFINPFIDTYFNYDPSDRAAESKGKRLKAATSIIAAVARRTSLTSNTARKKIVTVKDETREYKMSYLVCYRPLEGSTT